MTGHSNAHATTLRVKSFMLRSTFRVCLAAGLLAIAAHSFALNPHTLISQYAADHWSTRDGLPQATVGAIAQTTDGYIWLATEEGLVRFDGVRFTVFDSTNSALTDNYLSGLAAGERRVVVDSNRRDLVPLQRGHDPGGVLGPLDWPGLHADSRGSLGRDLEPRRGRAHGVRVELASAGTIAFDAAALDAVVTSLVENADGSILIGTSRGLKQFNRRLDDRRAESGSAGDVIGQRAVRGSRRRIVDRRRRRALLRSSAIHPRRWGAAEGIPQSTLNAILQDKDGSIWFGTNSGGVGRVRGDRVEALTTASGLPNDRIRSLFEDREGGLWLGTVEGGAVRLRDGSATTFGRHQGLRGTVVRALLQDRSGPFLRRRRRQRPRRAGGGRDVHDRSRARALAHGQHSGVVRRWRRGRADRVQRRTVPTPRATS